MRRPTRRRPVRTVCTDRPVSSSLDGGEESGGNGTDPRGGGHFGQVAGNKTLKKPLDA